MKLIWTREDDLTYGLIDHCPFRDRIEAQHWWTMEYPAVFLIWWFWKMGKRASGTNNSHSWHSQVNFCRMEEKRPTNPIESIGDRLVHGQNEVALNAMLDEMPEIRKRPYQFPGKPLWIKFTRALATLEKSRRNFSNWGTHQNLAEQKEFAFCEHGSTRFSAYVRISLNQESAKSVVS